MLQFILTESERFSVGEIAQMAIEGGCRWITLDLPLLSDVELRQLIVPEVVDMCREANVFLTVDDRPDLARELNIHGVRISSRFFLNHPGTTPLDIRNELGPEAVIGIEITDAALLPSLLPADLDFVTLPSGFGEDARARFINDARAHANTVPIVAQGNFTVDQALMAIADGCAGVAVGHPISSVPNPVETMQSYIDALAALRQPSR